MKGSGCSLFLQPPPFLLYEEGILHTSICGRRNTPGDKYVCHSDFMQRINAKSPYHAPNNQIQLQRESFCTTGLVLFLQLFWLFLFFSLKSIDHHKNPGNTTKEKTNVQLKSKNPELRMRRGTGRMCTGSRRVIPMGMAAVMGDT